MTELDEQGRPEPPMNAGEVETLLGYLDFQRATLAWRCSGVDAAGLQMTVAASTMTLGGLMKHLAFVEDAWAHSDIAGIEKPQPWCDVDWDADPDWEWHSAKHDTPEELMAIWRHSVERSQHLIDAAIAEGGLDHLGARPSDNGEHPSLRWILVHLIEEYARHNGHADLLREAIDGETGE